MVAKSATISQDADQLMFQQYPEQVIQIELSKMRSTLVSVWISQRIDTRVLEEASKLLGFGILTKP